jgi:hypothetical protein
MVTQIVLQEKTNRVIGGYHGWKSFRQRHSLFLNEVDWQTMIVFDHFPFFALVLILVNNTDGHYS